MAVNILIFVKTPNLLPSQFIDAKWRRFLYKNNNVLGGKHMEQVIEIFDDKKKIY